jgi:hypothetical protein
MSLKTLLFVSESLLGGDAEAEQLAAIVKSSQDRNLRLGVSAALVAARGQFAQLLEGPAEGLRSLMASIKRDPRHRNLRIVLEQDQGPPELAPSPMELVYRGDSFYVAREIVALLVTDPDWAGRSARAQRLHYLIRELAHPGAA